MLSLSFQECLVSDQWCSTAEAFDGVQSHRHLLGLLRGTSAEASGELLFSRGQLSTRAQASFFMKFDLGFCGEVGGEYKQLINRQQATPPQH